ncbi:MULTISPECIES: glycosyltransferase [Streptomyces]|uniref:glycosyltransferase n=1 Tax=Streptomyces TaxID=1883 RepID=UPI001E65C668|nr:MULTISPECIES: glycosyltransferase [Streptomyces]UFQ17110.1 glycosyltransferase [Streptomyces huasconensis]WCL86710.1 glycosyltransferase [Streptomyces sp. JCM 35825]
MRGRLVLIEPYANRLGGHHQRTLVALAQARPGSLVIAPHGIASESVRALHEADARLVTAPAGSAATVLLAVSRVVAGLSAAGQRVFRSRRWPRRLRRVPHQITLLARCLTEASALRSSRRLVSDADAVVILTASEALHGAAALLGGQPHLRFVHEAVTAEDAVVRLLGRLARRGEQRVIAVYPTQAVGDQFAAAFADLPAVVGAFAVDDGRRLSDAERDGGRAAFNIPAAEVVVCLVGGWWPYKDITVVDAALARLKEPLHLVVTGSPLDEAFLQRWRCLPGLRVHTVPGPVSDSVLRLVYAAADAALVTRRSGTGKESGLIMDAARLGVPLIISEHDGALTTRLHGQPWALMFPAGDPDALADALHTVIRQPPPLPGPEAPVLLGMRSAAEQADFLTRTFAPLRTKES